MLSYEYDRARQGAVDLIISLTPGQAKALGAEAGLLADWLDTALQAIARLRGNEEPEGSQIGWRTAVNDIDRRLLQRVEGVRDAVVRAWLADGASIADVASAMDVPRSTAQYRIDVLRESAPSVWELWARSELDKPGATE